MFRIVSVSLILLLPGLAYSQEAGSDSYGKFFTTIYANFHRGITGAATDEAAFALERGYFGYEYHISPEFYGKIGIDIGSPDDISPLSKIRRYAYFKNAFLRYTKNLLQIEFGMISLRQFNLQEEVWERRYLMKTIADENRLGFAADLGVNFNYKFSEALSADFTVTNGEGYTNLQMDDKFKYSLAALLKFPKNIITRAGYDFMHNGITESTIFLFSSYDFRLKWNIAGEFILKQNYGLKENHDIWGVSFFGKYNLNTKYQLFARFDKVGSNIPEDELNLWHFLNDGTALTTGIQYSPVKKIKFALNYQDWQPQAVHMKGGSLIFLNLELKI